MTGSAVPGIIAARAVRTERRLVAELRERRAFSSSTAVPLEARGGLAERRLRRLLDARVIHEAQPGRYWLEESKWEGREQRRLRRKIAVLAVILLAVVAGLLLNACARERPAAAGSLSSDPREDSLLRAGDPRVVRKADSLLVGGVLFVNDTTEGDEWRVYAYDGRIERTPFHGVRVGFYEGRSYTLVNDHSGLQSRVHARPVVSPSGEWLATASFDLEAGFDPNALTVLHMEYDTVSVAWTIEPDVWGPDSVDWRGNDTLHVVQRWRTETPGTYERREALVVRRDSTWDLVQGPPGVAAK